MKARAFGKALILLTIPVALLVSIRASADMGEIEINGEPVPASLFAAWANHSLPRNDRCPPLSDTRVRDRVIDLWVIRLDGRERFGNPDDKTTARIAELERDIEARTEADQSGRARDRVVQLIFESGHYHSLQYPEFDRAAINAEYIRAIESGDPELVDVVVVRRRTLDLESDEQVTEARALLQRGVDFADVIDAVAPGVPDRFESDYWYLPSSIRGYRGDGLELATGDVLGPYETRFGTYYVHLEEVMTWARIRPDQFIANTRHYARDLLQRRLANQHMQDIKDALWERYEVREDGQRIARSTNYPSCPGATMDDNG